MGWFSSILDNWFGIDPPKPDPLLQQSIDRQTQATKDAQASAKASADAALKAQKDANLIAQAASVPNADSESVRSAADERRRKAFQVLDKMWADLSGFFYAKQAQVDGQGNAVVPRLTMMIGGHPAAQIGPDGAVRPPWIYDGAANEETQQNQALPAPLKDVSPSDMSPKKE